MNQVNHNNVTVRKRKKTKSSSIIRNHQRRTVYNHSQYRVFPTSKEELSTSSPVPVTSTSYVPFSEAHFSRCSSHQLVASFFSTPISTFFVSPGCKNTLAKPLSSRTGR